MDPEIAELWQLFKKWSETNTGTLELADDGSGGIRMSHSMGDHYRDDQVVYWSNLTEGVKALTLELEADCPGARAFRQQFRRRRPRTPVQPS